jgi:hypothetical protein
MDLRRLVWMEKGNRRFRRSILRLEQEESWWRTSWLLAELHNGFLATVKSLGGASSERPKSPKDMNPIERSKRQTALQESDPGTDAAFELAAQHEARRREREAANGK